MSDRFTYTEQQWQSIRKAAPDREVSREALEVAATFFLRERAIANSIKMSKTFLIEWKRVAAATAALTEAIKAVQDDWTLGDWGPVHDGQRFDDAMTVDSHLAGLRLIASHASSNIETFRFHTAAYEGRRDPDKARFYELVLRAWTQAGGALQVSTAGKGPLGRYFVAALQPVLADQTPSFATVKNIVENEKNRRISELRIEGELEAYFRSNTP